MRKFNKIFGIGPGKTGGHSLSKAFSTLGLSVRHLGDQSVDTRYRTKKPTWISKQMYQNSDAGRPILHGVEEHDGYVDWPCHMLFKELDEQNPDSLFVLTYRNPDDIAASWCRMCYQFDFPGNQPTYLKRVTDVRNHYDKVFDHFQSRTDRLLILDTVRNKKNFSKLCAFMEVPVRDDPWPHCFDHQEWYKK